MKLLVFGYGGESTLAVSNILSNLSKEIIKEQDVEIVLFGYGDKKDNKKISEKLNVISIKDPFRKGSLSRYRFIRKTHAIFKKDSLCLSWKKLYKKSLSIFKNDHFDCIIGASGYFMYMEAAYRFARKTNSKFGSLYFDPFTNNVGLVNSKKRKKIEQRWYDYASFILYESQNRKLEIEDKKKIIHFYSIPIFEHNSVVNKDGPIVYGGTFYKTLRSPELLIDFLDKDICKDEKFEIYTNSKYFSITNKNVSVKAPVSGESFQKICLDSKALIIIGNQNAESVIPSKVLEAISFKKPIIGICPGSALSILEKYKFFFDSNDPSVFGKINTIIQKDANAFSIYSTYPERNPSILVKLILNLIKN